MYEELLLGKPPEWLELEGSSSFNLSSAQTRSAPAAGVVIESRPSKSIIGRGETVITIRGSQYIAAQRRFLRALQTSGKSSSAFKTAHDRLRRLKFATRQINEIVSKRAIIDPLPIISPKAGLVTDVLPDGSAFCKSDQLFNLTSDRYVEVVIEEKIAAYLRPNKIAEVSHSGPAKLVRFIAKSATDGSGQCCCRFQPIEPCNLQGKIPLRLHFDVWERLSPTHTFHNWPYPLPPRGEALYSLGLKERPTPAPSVIAAPLKKNPFAADADKRPSRIDAPYAAPGNRGKTLETYRHTLELPYLDWQNLRIATTAPEARVFTPKWEKSASLRTNKGRDERQVITAPHEGFFKPLINQGRLITSKAVIGHISPDKTGEGGWLPVVSTSAGSLAEISGAALVSAGDTIAIISPTTYVLSISIDERLDHAVRMHVCHLSRRADVILGIPPTLLCDQAINPAGSFDVPFPSGLGPFEEGHALSVFLDAPDASRTSLGLPPDCVMRIGKSHEVLLHHGSGKLTPVSIQLGLKHDFVEIPSGLFASARVVRDLEQLCRLDPRLRALMTGFWMA